MSFNIINASKNIANKYKRYLKTIFDISDPCYKEIFNNNLDNVDPFSKGPFLDVINSFQKGETVKNLIEQGYLSKDFKYIDDIYNKTLYKHQEIALKKILEKKNLVVSTGTGSGKTECFLIPIINDLMREKEQNNGVLTPGVRTLIIYPMNALANDQIERLRRLLARYPDITFGCYTGQTAEKERNALLEYKKLNRDPQTGFELEPLENEIISREKMKENPPHILITNYAMLEYLMLRPADSVFFDGEFANSWKYIVLDEAHTYSGSTGIEVSMLMRRVIAKLNNPKVQYILTSATLGSEETNSEVVEFASRLCNASFYEEDIVRAYRVKLNESNESITLSNNFYKLVSSLLDDGYEDEYILNEISKFLKITISTQNLSEFLYNLLLRDGTYWKVKKYLFEPKSTNDICEYMNWTSQELSDFVSVASMASKDRTKLFDSRYHFFVRATEGVFVTLNPHKNLFLTRKNYDYYNGKKYKVFEALTCSQCHALYIVGNIEDNILVQKSNVGFQDVKEAFYIGDQINNFDEDNLLENEDLRTDKFELCPYCGFIRNAKQVNKNKCNHSEEEYVKVTKVASSKLTGRVTKCLCCESVNRLGILRSFFTGQEASTSVIGTALFEELPHYEKHIIVSKDIVEDDGFEMTIPENTIINKEKAKQFIAFSDSRQAAAYFSSYFSETYDGLLYGKILSDCIKEHNKENILIPHLIKELAHKFKDNNIHSFGDKTPDYELEAWKAVLKELIDNKSRHSLTGLGLISIDYENIKFLPNNVFGFSEDDIKTICLIFVLGMISDVAISYDKGMSDADREFFTHNGVEKIYLLTGSELKYARSFLPKNTSKTNKRFDYIERLFKAKNMEDKIVDIQKFLEALWKRFFEKTELLKIVTGKTPENGYKVDLSKISIGNERKWYICPKCKRLTAYNVANVCPTYKCDGVLQKVNVDEIEKNNHYYRMYNDMQIQPLRVVEHTAQLSRDKAYEYQNLFKQQKIDVLSCSTTFEMGVDVGNLETVFMRNMPPAPSNYTQRAGRAGRSTKSAAFALTFCNKSNHDFNYYNDPISMINGVITPPLFKVENEKICIRHIYSSALAFFWKKYPNYFKTAETMMENNNGDKTGFDLFKEYLYSKPSDLKEYLKLFLSNYFIEKFEINSFGWVDLLFDKPADEYPNFTKVYDLYTNEIQTLLADRQKAFDSNNSINSIDRILRTYREEDIISFLSKNSILPKYGFPVDTVELEVSNSANLKVDLSRDLSIAISEYAPGCQVVVDGELITSRYIKKQPNKGWKLYDYIRCPHCQSLNISIHTEFNQEKNLTNCKQCNEEFNEYQKRIFLIPEFGFISDFKIEKPTLIKPERTFRTEASFVNYENNLDIEQYRVGNMIVDVSSMDNGAMAILTTDDFFVCPTCGFSKDISEISSSSKSNNNEAGIQFLKSIEYNHKNNLGRDCLCNKLKKYSLGYRFETDVLILRFNKITNFDSANSVLQALILGACKTLDIDNNEVAGCLQYYNSGIYNFILYDKTPGGAGHVKRLKNEEMINKLIHNAFDIANNCTCGDEEGDSSCYSCLRTYQNQHYHDRLKRKHVINYFNFLKNDMDIPF